MKTATSRPCGTCNSSLQQASPIPSDFNTSSSQGHGHEDDESDPTISKRLFDLPIVSRRFPYRLVIGFSTLNQDSGPRLFSGLGLVKGFDTHELATTLYLRARPVTRPTALVINGFHLYQVRRYQAIPASQDRLDRDGSKPFALPFCPGVRESGSPVIESILSSARLRRFTVTSKRARPFLLCSERIA